MINCCLLCLKPAVVGLIGAAVISTGVAVFFPSGFSLNVISTLTFWKSLVIFIISLVLVFKKVHPIKMILLSAFLGIIIGFI